MCRVGEYNCSFDCLTSPSVLSELLKLPQTNPKLYAELSSGATQPLDGQEEEMFEQYSDGDDSSIPIEALVEHIISEPDHAARGSQPHLMVDDQGYLARTGVAESLEASEEDVQDGAVESVGRKMASVGRRRMTKPKRFGGDGLWDQNSCSESED